jgi:hypothetical protein
MAEDDTRGTAGNLAAHLGVERFHRDGFHPLWCLLGVGAAGLGRQQRRRRRQDEEEAGVGVCCRSTASSTPLPAAVSSWQAGEFCVVEYL